MSYAMAWLKSDYIFHYRRKKRGLTRSGRSENELRSMLLGKHKDKRHDYRDWIKPGGAAWIAVQSWKAELKARRASDKKQLAKVIQREARDGLHNKKPPKTRTDVRVKNAP